MAQIFKRKFQSVIWIRVLIWLQKLEGKTYISKPQAARYTSRLIAFRKRLKSNFIYKRLIKMFISKNVDYLKGKK
tara:strand:+ start:238 stop:462 length:225 start_codon:yes stop_codon:yes gene_type:complete